MGQTHGGLVGRCQVLCKKRSKKQNIVRYSGSGALTKGRPSGRPFFVQLLDGSMINW